MHIKNRYTRLFIGFSQDQKIEQLEAKLQKKNEVMEVFTEGGKKELGKADPPRHGPGPDDREQLQRRRADDFDQGWPGQADLVHLQLGQRDGDADRSAQSCCQARFGGAQGSKPNLGGMAFTKLGRALDRYQVAATPPYDLCGHVALAEDGFAPDDAAPDRRDAQRYERGLALAGNSLDFRPDRPRRRRLSPKA